MPLLSFLEMKGLVILEATLRTSNTQLQLSPFVELSWIDLDVHSLSRNDVTRLVLSVPPEICAEALEIIWVMASIPPTLSLKVFTQSFLKVFLRHGGGCHQVLCIGWSNLTSQDTWLLPQRLGSASQLPAIVFDLLELFSKVSSIGYKVFRQLFHVLSQG